MPVPIASAPVSAAGRAAATSLQRVVPPVLEGVRPRHRGELVAGLVRALGEVALDVAVDLAHVRVVVAAEFALLLAEDGDDLPSRGVAGRLAPAVALPG